MRRVLLALLAVLILLPVAAVVAAVVLLDGEALKTRAADAVRRATGRELTIAGPVRFTWSLTPVIEALDVSLANPPGMSRPALAQAARIEAQVALWPLLSRRVEVRRVVVTAPDVLLERDGSGRPNWLVAPPAPPPAAPGPAQPGPSMRMQVVLGGIELRDAKLGYRAPALTETLEVKRLLLSVPDQSIKGEAVRNGVALALDGTAAPGSDGVWQYKLNVVGGGVAASFAGNPAQTEATLLAPDLAAATTLAGHPLPPLRDVQVSATFSPAGLTNVRLQAGAGVLAPGLRLTRLSGTAPGMAQPVQVSGEAEWGTLPVQFSVSAGSMAALLGGGPVPVQAAVKANDAMLGAQGNVTGLTLRGIELAVSARVPDLQRLGALAGVALPPLRDAALDGRLASAPSGLVLRGMRLSMLQGDLAGDLALGWTPRPSLRGSLVSQRLDLDAWAAGAVPAPAPSPAPALPTTTTTPPAAAAQGQAPARVIPDLPLPFALLRQADADLRVAVAEAVWHGTTLRTAEARLLLQDGKLRIDPAGLQGPGGPVQVQIAADATSTPPSLAVTVRAPGLAAGPLFAALGAPGESYGTVDLDAQLAASGATARQLAAALDGHLGLAMVDGEVENRWLAELLGEMFRAANLPIEPGGRSRVRCLALRADVVRGQAKLAALALDSTRLRLDGEGGANLAEETLDLHLRPQVRLGGAGLSAPFKLSGPFRRPKAGLDAGVLAPGRVGVVIGGAAAPDNCGPALTLARDGRAGPMPAAAAEPSRTRPADLLRSLLR